MSSYFGKYNTSGDVQTAVDNFELLKPYVALVGESEVDYDSKSIDYASKPLTLKITEAGTINMLGRANTTYSLNDGDFTYLPAYSYTTINVVSGDKIIFKNTDNVYGATFSSSTAGFEVFGNINYYNNSTSQGDCQNMFKDCTGLTSAENLILPATALTSSCYNSMFRGCTSLTTAPLILPATTLSNYCYESMFLDCQSLTSAPSLPATTLASGCYQKMFWGCTSLNYIKCLATNISASNCTFNWVRAVQITSGTFVTPSTTNWTTGNDGIPTNWTRVNSE